MRYINQSDRAFNYHPDMIAKKNGEIYVIEIKTTGGIRYLKGSPLKGLLMARNYGFIPALITVNVSIKATDLTVRELTNQESLGSGLG
jgi:Holliday junction resolvase